MNTTGQIVFTIPGPPVGKERARSAPGRHYTPRKTRDYEKMVGWLGWQALKKFPNWPLQPESWFRLTVDIYFGSKVRPDTSNVLKCVEDGLNKVIWKDDKTVVSGVRDVYFTQNPRVVVYIEYYSPKEEAE